MTGDKKDKKEKDITAYPIYVYAASSWTITICAFILGIFGGARGYLAGRNVEAAIFISAAIILLELEKIYGILFKISQK